MEQARLIVIDDDITFGYLIAEIVNLLDLDVDIVTSVKQFHQLYKQHSYDIVTTDISMPDKDGIEFINDLAALNCQAAVILISGKDASLLHGAEKLAQRKGLNLIATLQKPIDFDEFEDLIGNCIAST